MPKQKDEDASIFGFLRRQAEGKHGQPRHKSEPIPSAVEDNKEWKITEMNKLVGGVDLEGHEMFVPLASDDPLQTRVRAHEMSHVAITPRNASWRKIGATTHIPEILYQGMEDGRIHSRWQDDETFSKIMEDAPLFKDEKSKRDMITGVIKSSTKLDQRAALYLGAGLYFGGYATPEQPVMEEIADIEGLPVEKLAEIGKQLKAASHEEMLGLALQVQEIIEEIIRKGEESEQSEQGDPGDGEGEGEPGGGGQVMDSKPNPEDMVEKPPMPAIPGLGEVMPAPDPPELKDAPPSDFKTMKAIEGASSLTHMGYVSEKRVKEMMDKAPRARSDQPYRNGPPGGVTPEITERNGGWFPVRMREPKLVSDLKRKKRRETRYWRQSDRGAQLAQLHRVRIDGKVFRRKKTTKRREKHGSVLVDCSGSMMVTAEMVAKVLEESPAASIGLYSGNGYEGQLTVLACKGKEVADLNLEVEKHFVVSGGDNAIDGPALEWLAKQPEPRIWVSDGGVTGKGGSTKNLYAQCEALMRLHKITRIASLGALVRKEALEWAKKGKQLPTSDGSWLSYGDDEDYDEDYDEAEYPEEY